MELPDSIWLEICKFLQPKDLCKLALVNKSFHKIASNNYPWENILIQRHQKIPKGIENLKKNYAEINCMATRMISKYQSETLHFEKILDKERQRQKKALETKRIQRKVQRSLKELEGN
jgi:F-box-like